MATSGEKRGPERLDVYEVSFVVWSRQEGSEGPRRRELREHRFGGPAPEDAAAHAARWAKESCGTTGGWRFDGVEIVANRYALNIERCARCGEFRGLNEGSTVLCLCDGLRCKRCGKRNIWRPISDYYDEKEGGFWHVPHFAARSWCYACETARDEARRIFKQERPWGDERTLLEPGTSIASPEELRQLCAEPLIEALLFLAVWAPGVYGTNPAKCDRTFIVLSFNVSEDASAYVQFLSDPLHHTVLWEVSSLDYQPGLLDRLTPEREAALAARGFETGASPSNYRREVMIDGDASATAVAHEALDILFEVLGYRGEEALVLHVEAEEADEWDGVSGDFEPGRLAVLLRQDGYHLRTAEGESSAADRHLVVDVSDDIRITVSATPDGQRYSVSMPLKDLLRGRDALARTYPNGCVRVTCDANGIALLSSDVTLTPGETEERIRGGIGALAMEALQVRFESGDDSVR